MRETRIIMGMPVTICIADKTVSKNDFEKAFDYFKHVDEKFSPFKKTSELSKVNDGLLDYHELSSEMKEIMQLSNKTKQETLGYFNIVKKDGKIDTSGLVKGWAIHNASKMLEKNGFKNFFVDAGSDIQTIGKNEENEAWSAGIIDPFDNSHNKIVKKVFLRNNEGIATSGNYLRGQHIYNPHNPNDKTIGDIISLTVIGRNIYEADRFATAAFAMGREGINFIEKTDGLEGYMIDKDGIATYTSGFEKYTI